MRRILQPLASAIAVTALVLTNLYLFASPPDTSVILPSDQSVATTASKAEIPETSDASKMLLIHAQTRPLFSPTRRPWVAPPVEPVPVPVEPEPVEAQPVVAVATQPPQITLLGIDITPSGTKALTLKAGETDAVWMRAGELVDGWTVRQIKSTSIELENGSQSVTLELYPAPVAPPAATQGSQP